MSKTHLLKSREAASLCGAPASVDSPRTIHLDATTCPGCLARLGLELQGQAEKNGLEMLFGIGAPGTLPKLESERRPEVYRQEVAVGSPEQAKRIEDLTTLLRDLLECADELRGYASDYFVKKWRLDDPIEKVRLFFRQMETKR